ncbi:MAG: hypothetical protein J1F60_06430 [Oscillospiraceae bacterium]|nr:hypothetical protein [Oscillospiraceae bacterium]
MSDCKSNLEYNDEAIKLLLDTAISEYNNEHNRTSVIDSKVSISLPIVSAYFLSLASANDYKLIVEMPIIKFTDGLLMVLLLVSYIFSLIFALIAVLYLIDAIKTRDYKVIQPSALYDNDYLKFDHKVMSIKLIKLYIEAFESNKAKNDLRIPMYSNGWHFTIKSIVLHVISIILKNFA